MSGVIYVQGSTYEYKDIVRMIRSSIDINVSGTAEHYNMTSLMFSPLAYAVSGQSSVVRHLVGTPSLCLLSRDASSGSNSTKRMFYTSMTVERLYRHSGVERPLVPDDRFWVRSCCKALRYGEPAGLSIVTSSEPLPQVTRRVA